MRPWFLKLRLRLVATPSALHTVPVMLRNSAAVQIYRAMIYTSHAILARGMILTLESSLQDVCSETAMRLQRSF